MSNFHIDRNEKSELRLRGLIDELPRFCIEFFVGVAMRTSSLTRLNYAFDLRIFFDFMANTLCKGKIAVSDITILDLKDLTVFDIERFLMYLNNYTFDGKKSSCGAAAKERKLSTLRSFFKYYYKRDKLPENITAKVDLPKVHNKPITRLEIDEVVKIINGADGADGLTKHQKAYHSITKKRDVAILMLMLGTGIRISECVGLNRSDIDFEANAFRVIRKGGETSILYFNYEVRDALMDYLEWLAVQEGLVAGDNGEINKKTEFGIKIKDNEALFLSMQGNRISVRALQDLVKKYASYAAPLKKISPHKLRSTFGTNLYRETGDIYVVADILGHKDINTTKKHYAAMSDDIRRASANKVRLTDRGEK
ncbi:MAG: tyrosine-type recombinase/integrase [Firmicutes bacterium]|nr:tyrosine-type recombinase/integrase [Bacillota bacterium]